jgi:uncharacterized protein YndB with AHSA1/START domain
MDTTNTQDITIRTTVKAPVSKVWEYWSAPQHIKGWNNASDDWYTPRCENDLRTGGKFLSRMEARDGSMGFDFAGVYDEVREQQFISYHMGDGRKVEVTFSAKGNDTVVTETFEPEKTNPAEMQRNGWQSILDNFKRYVESH